MLYFVPVPVGNLGDITLRGLEILEAVEIILAEDGQKTSQLLQLLKIKNKPQIFSLTSYHKFNFKKVETVLTTIKNQQISVAVCSDSGMPGISDPGTEVVKMAQKMQINYTVLPGSSSLLPAVVASGLSFKEFKFLGFLPIKKGRQKVWQKIKESTETVVLFESKHRLNKMLTEIKTILEPDRKVFIAKEISKKNEKYYDFVAQNAEKIEIDLRGEFVIVIKAKRN